MIAWIHNSNQKGNAPPGYVIARVQLAPGLFVDAEFNSFTEFKFTCWVLYRTEPGNEDCGEGDARALCSFNQPTHELCEVFDAIRTMYFDTYLIITEKELAAS